MPHHQGAPTSWFPPQGRTSLPRSHSHRSHSSRPHRVHFDEGDVHDDHPRLSRRPTSGHAPHESQHHTSHSTRRSAYDAQQQPHSRDHDHASRPPTPHPAPYANVRVVKPLRAMTDEELDREMAERMGGMALGSERRPGDSRGGRWEVYPYSTSARSTARYGTSMDGERRGRSGTTSISAAPSGSAVREMRRETGMGEESHGARGYTAMMEEFERGRRHGGGRTRY